MSVILYDQNMDTASTGIATTDEMRLLNALYVYVCYDLKNV